MSNQPRVQQFVGEVPTVGTRSTPVASDHAQYRVEKPFAWGLVY
jgi:hypothetical protein